MMKMMMMMMLIRYNDMSPLENHHCAVSFKILSSPESNIFANMSEEEFKVNLRVSCIIFTAISSGGQRRHDHPDPGHRHGPTRRDPGQLQAEARQLRLQLRGPPQHPQDDSHQGLRHFKRVQTYHGVRGEILKFLKGLRGQGIPIFYTVLTT